MTDETPALQEELRWLRSRVEKIERKVGLLSPTVMPKAKPEPPPAVAPDTAPDCSPTNFPIHSPASAPADRSGGGEAGKALGIVAVICFVLAASFLIKLAIDSGWLTPENQLALSAMLGLSLIGAGLAGPIKDSDYLSLLPAAGLVVLYMTAYGGALFWDLYGSGVAAMVASGISLLALALLPLPLLQHPVFTMITVSGTYLATLLLPDLRGGTFQSMVFFLVWDLAFAFWATSLASRPLLLLAGYLAIGCFAGTSATVFWTTVEPQELLRAASFQFVQFLVFAGGAAAYSRRTGQPMNESEAWAFFPLLVFFYGTEYYLLTRLAPAAAPWIAFCFAAVLYGIYSVSREAFKREALESEAMVNGFVAVVLVHAGYFELLPERWAHWFAVALLAAVPLARGADFRVRYAPYAAAAIVVIGLNLVKAFLGLGLDGIGPTELWALNGVFAALLFAGYALLAAEIASAKSVDARTLVLALAVGQAMTGISRLAIDAQLGPFGVTLLWAFLGAGLLVWGETRRDSRLVQSAVGVLGVSAGKALLLDVSNADPVVRIGCLLGIGAVLYVSGYLLRRTRAWAKQS